MKEKLSILVVEDNPLHQKYAKEMLAEHDLVLATDYSQAIRSLKEKKFQVLMTDLMFPLGGRGYVSTEDTYDEKPLGYAVAFYAARPHIAVPMIGLLTDLNHHSNAISATFDNFKVKGVPSKIIEPHLVLNVGAPDEKESERPVIGRPLFKINESYFVMFDSRDLHELYLGLDGKITDERCNGPQVKNWSKCLERLLQIPK